MKTGRAWEDSGGASPEKWAAPTNRAPRALWRSQDEGRRIELEGGPKPFENIHADQAINADALGKGDHCGIDIGDIKGADSQASKPNDRH